MTGQVYTPDTKHKLLARRVAEITQEYLGLSIENSVILAESWLEWMVTQECDDCGAVIAVHPDAKWRFDLHAIRCDACVSTAEEERGYDSFEARYVM